jgi:opacity protein-like surface antigen
MRRFLSVLAAMVCGAVSGAHAADLPDIPILRGTQGLSTSTVNWQGFYVGAQGGYGSSSEYFNGSNANLLAVVTSGSVVQQIPGVAQFNPIFGQQTDRSWGYGVFGGYNSQWDDVVIGLEASYLHGPFGGTSTASGVFVSPARLSDTLFHDAVVTSSTSMSITDMATFRARAAYVWGCFLPYMFGGFALGNADILRSAVLQDSVSVNPGGPFSQLPLSSASLGVHDHLIYGYTAGLGVDINLIGGLFMRAEWEYVRFATNLLNVTDPRLNTVRAGLGYKF